MGITRLLGANESTFSSTSVALNASGTRVYNGSVVANLVLTNSGTPTPGTKISLLIEAGDATTSITTPGSWNVTTPAGYVFSSALTTLIQLEVSGFAAGTLVKGTLRQLVAPDVTLPTVDTVTAADASDQLTVVFSEPMAFISLTGLSLDFSVGTARTISSLTSGNGTDTLVFTLSGAIDSADVFDFDTAVSCGIHDLFENQPGATSTAASVSGGGAVMPQLGAMTTRFSGALQTTAIGTAVDNFGTGADGTALGTLSHSGGWFRCNNNSSSGISGPPIPTGDYTLFFRARRAATPSDFEALTPIIAANDDGGHGFLWYQSGGFNLEHDGQTLTVSGTDDGWVVGDVHDKFVVYNSTTNVATLYHDDETTPLGTYSFTDDAVPTTAMQWMTWASGSFGWMHEARECCIWTVQLSESERTQAIAAADAS